MSTLRDAMRAALEAGDTPEQAYDRAVADVDKDQLAEHFRPLGIEEARHLVRSASRKVENRLFGRGGLTVERHKAEHRVRGVRDILATTVWFDAGQTVSWLDATVEQHEQRAVEQEQRAEVLHEDADRHRQAVKILRECGKQKLADVDDEALERVVD